MLIDVALRRVYDLGGERAVCAVLQKPLSDFENIPSSYWSALGSALRKSSAPASTQPAPVIEHPGISSDDTNAMNQEMVVNTPDMVPSSDEMQHLGTPVSFTEPAKKEQVEVSVNVVHQASTSNNTRRWADVCDQDEDVDLEFMMSREAWHKPVCHAKKIFNGAISEYDTNCGFTKTNMLKKQKSLSICGTSVNSINLNMVLPSIDDWLYLSQQCMYICFFFRYQRSLCFLA